jgi:hypothetical protein
VLCLLCAVFLQALQATPFHTSDFPSSTIQHPHACLTLSHFMPVSVNLGTVYRRSDMLWDGKCFPFLSLFVTVTFINPLMRPRVPPRSMKITAFIFLIFDFPMIESSRHCAPQIKQASPSTAFLLLLLPPRLLANTISYCEAYSKHHGKRRDKTRRLRQLMPSMSRIVLLFSVLILRFLSFRFLFLFLSSAQPNV